MENVRKAIIYCRVSSDKQVAEGHGIESQEHNCRTYAESLGFPVSAVFHDDGVSGALLKRPGITQLFSYITKHPFDKFVVVVDDLSRIARDVSVHVFIREQLRKMDAELMSPNFHLDDTPEGELGENMMASLNQYNRKANRRQVMQKMRARMETGHWTFCMPSGMKNIKDPVNGKMLVRKEPLATIFQTAIERFRDRTLITQSDVVAFIQQEYKSHGINKKISLHGVQDILMNILYAGYLEYPKWQISRRKAVHEGIISIETFDEVQRILAGRTKPKSRADTNPAFPLRGLILCGECQKPMTASFNNGRSGQRYPDYFCKTEGCPLRYKVIKKDVLENDFLAMITRTPPDKAIFGLAGEVIADVWKQREKQVARFRQQNEALIGSLTEKIDRLTDRISQTEDPSLISLYEKQVLKQQSERDSLQSENQDAVYTGEKFGTAVRKVMETLENPVRTWQTGSLDDRLMVYFMHFDKRLVYRRNVGFGTAPLADSVDLIHFLGSGKKPIVEMPGSGPGSG